MKEKRFRTLGVFGRTYAMMVGTVLLAETLIFSAVIFNAPPTPPFVEYEFLVDTLGVDASKAAPRLMRKITSNPGIGRPADRTSMVLGRAIDRSLGLQQGTMRARLGPFAPPSPFGTLSTEDVAAGKNPLLVAGEITLARPLDNGTWLVVETDTSFANAALWRFVMVLLGTLALVVPCAYFLAHRMTRPISNFALAADRLGRDPHAPPVPENGPREVRVASEAFNRMQRRLNTYIEERTTMVAAVAHDLRTPLMRMAFEIEDAPERLQTALSRQIGEMSKMIDAIMRFLEAEQSRHERRECDLSALLVDVVNEFQDDGSDVSLQNPDDGLIMDGDPVGLKSVLRNVIGNAVVYGTTARISLSRRRDNAVITVTDRGPGLTKADFEQVFQPFYRVEKSRNRKTGGIGLGLAVARSIVVAHGGSITLANGEQGGLIATIRLPVS